MEIKLDSDNNKVVINGETYIKEEKKEEVKKTGQVFEELEKGQEYWIDTWSEIKSVKWSWNNFDKGCMANGEAFHNKESCEQHKAKKEALFQLNKAILEINGGEIPKKGYYLCMDYDNIDFNYGNGGFHIPIFTSGNKMQRLIREQEENIKIIFNIK